MKLSKDSQDVTSEMDSNKENEWQMKVCNSMVGTSSPKTLRGNDNKSQTSLNICEIVVASNFPLTKR